MCVSFGDASLPTRMGGDADSWTRSEVEIEFDCKFAAHHQDLSIAHNYPPAASVIIQGVELLNKASQSQATLLGKCH